MPKKRLGVPGDGAQLEPWEVSQFRLYPEAFGPPIEMLCSNGGEFTRVVPRHYEMCGMLPQHAQAGLREESSPHLRGELHDRKGETPAAESKVNPVHIC